MIPKLRKEAAIDLQCAVTGAIWSQFLRNDIFPFQSCMSCKNFTEATELCKLANARPPAKVIAFGCSSYEDKMEVPF